MGYKPLVTALDMLGTYSYAFRTGVYPRPQFTPMTCRVQVVAQTNLSYRVKLLEFHADGRRPGTVITVQRRKVKIDPVAAPEAPAIRLPYKDND